MLVAAVFILGGALGFGLGYVSRPGNPSTPTTGASQNPVTVPDVSGLTVKAATLSLSDVGLQVEIKQEQGSAQTGTVIRQAPAAGTAVNPGTAVQIVVSVGPN
jgi:serine/threonine-protein kinase